jgi:hypothetical protein
MFEPSLSVTGVPTVANMRLPPVPYSWQRLSAAIVLQPIEKSGRFPPLRVRKAVIFVP